MSPQAKMDAELTEIVEVDLKFEVKNVNSPVHTQWCEQLSTLCDVIRR